MRGWGVFFGGLIAGALPAAAGGAEPAPSPQPESILRRAPSDFPPVLVLPSPIPSYLKIQGLLAKSEFVEARTAIDQQLAKEINPDGRSSLFVMRGAVDAELKDVSSYRRDLGEAAKLSSTPKFLLPQLIVHASDFDEQTAIDFVGQYARLHQGSDSAFDEITVWNLMQQLYQTNHRKVYDELVLAFAAISYGTAMPKDELYLKAAEILGARGRVPAALHYARLIRERGTLVDILTDRRFEPLWPELERTVGDRLENFGRAQLSAAQAEFKKEPDRLDLRLQLMQAYVDLGMLNEADKLGSEVGRNRQELEALNGATAYVVDTHAKVLLLTQGVDAAERRMAALVDTWTPQRTFVINMAINRIGMLFEAHRYTKSLSLLDQQKWQLEGFSSQYAKQLLRALRVGNLMGLGRRSEALAIVPDILASAADAPAATLGALLLAEQDDKAEPLALEWLKDPRQRTTVLQFLRIGDSTKADDPLAAEATARFRKRPALAQAFQNYGRDLPQALRREP